MASLSERRPLIHNLCLMSGFLLILLGEVFVCIYVDG